MGVGAAWQLHHSMKETNMSQSNQEGVYDGAMKGQTAAQEGYGLSAQQPGESADAYAQRVAAYNAAKAQQQQQSQQENKG
jgi:hypothetical protein